MIVRVTWEFDADIDDLDPKFVDIYGHAKDLAKLELAYLLEHKHLTADDFEYAVVME